MEPETKMIATFSQMITTWTLTAPTELSSWSLIIVGFVLVGQMLRLARSGLA
jgi:uncharacterized membrane protein YoaT (DUF817 family)